MGLRPGTTNNIAGRPKGSPNVITANLRELITSIVEKHFSLESVEIDLKELTPKDRLTFLSRLLDFVLPRMRAAEIKIENEILKDEQLDEIFGQILNK